MQHRTVRVAAIAALLLVVALVVVVILRLGRADDAGQRTPTGPLVSATASPTYSPTDAYGSPEPGLAPGDAEAGAGGRSTGPAGLPLGYDRTEAGAVSAATNYLTWLNSLRIIDKAAADAMASEAASDGDTKTALIDSFDQLRSGMTDLKVDEVQPARGAYALRSYSSSRALVYVWAPEVTTTREGKTDHQWSIDAVPLVWASNDWKLDGELIARSGGAAVDPADPAGNPTASEKHAILVRTPADPGEITDSADQTWLEYANAAH